jgi:hypothetical protein
MENSDTGWKKFGTIVSFYADKDPTPHVHADPDPDPTRSFTHAGKTRNF